MDRRRPRPPSTTPTSAPPLFRGASQTWIRPSTSSSFVAPSSSKDAAPSFEDTKQGPHLDDTEDESRPLARADPGLGGDENGGSVEESLLSAQTTHEMMVHEAASTFTSTRIRSPRSEGPKIVRTSTNGCATACPHSPDGLRGESAASIPCDEATTRQDVRSTPQEKGATATSSAAHPASGSTLYPFLCQSESSPESSTKVSQPSGDWPHSRSSSATYASSSGFGLPVLVSKATSHPAQQPFCVVNRVRRARLEASSASGGAATIFNGGCGERPRCSRRARRRSLLGPFCGPRSAVASCASRREMSTQRRIDGSIAARVRAAGLPAQDLLCVYSRCSVLAQASAGQSSVHNVSLQPVCYSFYAVAAA
mmetsp:Transcript_12562/g.33116  ORF Transcript_12562/g.33116 Transcript_12562/m.33116 type:complete len:367 (-) Transcript_12562:39-1139(-)